jgi:flagellum-specific ATP synthase
VSGRRFPSLAAVTPQRVVSRVRRIVGLEIEAGHIHAAIGDLVWIGDSRRPAEVVAIRDDAIVMMPFGSVEGIAAGDAVEASGQRPTIEVGDGLIGRVVDATGLPIDGLGPIAGLLETVDYANDVPNPMTRQRISEPLSLGVRAVDTMLTCGQGQRIGIMAGSGVGKSTLLGMMARGTDAEIVVVGLVGERGREVREFLEDDLGPEGRKRSCVVVATSDEPALMRRRAAIAATRIAEHFADQGKDVLLLMDSLTRVAMAQRDIGLAAGEPPTTRGYPPSTFSILPQLLERAGPRQRGSITGIYAVLVEGDDMNEPVADSARSILDGHLVLSRRLAAAGHYPTLDVLESASRLATKLCDREQLDRVQHLRRLMSAFDEARDLVEIGAYRAGADPDVDEYLARRDAIMAFLRQDMHDVAQAEASWAQLEELLGTPVAAPALATALATPHSALPPSPAVAADAYRAELTTGSR